MVFEMLYLLLRTVFEITRIITGTQIATQHLHNTTDNTIQTLTCEHSTNQHTRSACYQVVDSIDHHQQRHRPQQQHEQQPQPTHHQQHTHTTTTTATTTSTTTTITTTTTTPSSKTRRRSITGVRWRGDGETGEEEWRA